MKQKQRLNKDSGQINNDEEILKMTQYENLKLTTLRVKQINSNECTYLLKMKSTDKIQNVKDLIKSQRFVVSFIIR